MVQMSGSGKLTMALAAVLLSSCSGGEQPQEMVDVNGVQVPARIQIATASVGGSYHPVGTAIAQVLSNSLDGVIATAENSSGSNQNIRMLDASQIHFGLANAAITFPAFQGLGEFEKAFPVTAAISLQSSVAVVVSLKDSGITTFQDLVGKRVTTGPAGGGWDYFVEPILSGHGVTYDQFQQIYESQANAMDLLKDGAVDAVVVGGSVPHVTITAAMATHELQFLPMDPDSVAQINAAYPFIRPVTIPAGTYPGQTEDMLAVDSGTAQLLVRADADPDLVYLVTRTIYENRERIAEIHPGGREITPERAAMDIGIPYHEGSLRYFNEIGIWHPRNEAVDE
jgi:TRAP transporter TAXI family solute receptor